MTWVMWRQHRQQAIVALAAFGALALFFGISGPAMSHTYHSSGLASCIASHAQCGDLLNAFDAKYNTFQFLIPLFLVLPALFGVFWGAPLIARELEQGTFRFAWTQSVSRRRWAVAKLATVEAATLSIGAAFAGLVTWWSLPLVNSHTDRFVPGVFDLRGVVPVAYMLFAIALGIALGQLIGKLLPAMGATLVGFGAVRFLITIFARKHYLPAKHLVSPLASLSQSGRVGRAAWVLADNVIDKAGNVVARGGNFDFAYLQRHCPNIPLPGPQAGFAVPATGRDPVLTCVQSLGLRTASTFQPISRYWTFQWIEFGIYVALAAALAGFVIWRIKRPA
jgi:hypothetical protein